MTQSSSEPGSAPAAMDGLPYAGRIDAQWTAQWIRRTLTDEPGPGMGSPFSEAHARLFLRACGLAPPGGPFSAADTALLERMCFWLDTHRS